MVGKTAVESSQRSLTEYMQIYSDRSNANGFRNTDYSKYNSFDTGKASYIDDNVTNLDIG